MIMKYNMKKTIKNNISQKPHMLRNFWWT